MGRAGERISIRRIEGERDRLAARADVIRWRATSPPAVEADVSARRLDERAAARIRIDVRTSGDADRSGDRGRVTLTVLENQRNIVRSAACILMARLRRRRGLSVTEVPVVRIRHA